MPGYVPKPIFDTKQAKRDPRIPDDLPTPPLCMTICAPRLSGKTAICLGMISDVYAKVFDHVIIMSDTAAYDSSVQALKKTTRHKNISIMDDVSNESIAAIVKTQKEAFDAGSKESLLLFIDDSGDAANSKELNKELSKLYTKGRHSLISIIVAIQSISGQLTRKMKGCTTEWIIFKNSADDCKIISRVLASTFLSEKEVYAYLMDVTTTPYSFAYVNTRAKNVQDMYRFCDPKLGFQHYFEA